MKLLNILRALIATGTFAAAQAGAAPILQISSAGMLTGATGVSVGGTLYDVSFKDGTCNSLYDNCNPTNFLFSTVEETQVAGNALLSQVLIDNGINKFDSAPETVQGCGYTIYCQTFIPFRFNAGDSFSFGVVTNYFSNASDNVLSQDTFPASFDTSNSTPYNFAVFTLPATSVPEPDSTALIGIAMAAVLFARRRRA